MKSFAALLLLAGSSTAVAGDCCPQYSVAYVEETVVVKKPVLIKRVPVTEVREKQITVKETVVVGYKEEVVEAVPHKTKRNLLGGLFKKKVHVGCASCE